jgi:hypothetical protein
MANSKANVTMDDYYADYKIYIRSKRRGRRVALEEKVSRDGGCFFLYV